MAPSGSPRGEDALKTFLQSNKPLSAAKEELPHTLVSREALLAVAAELYQEVERLKAAMNPASSSTPALHASPSPSGTGGAQESRGAGRPEEERICKWAWKGLACEDPGNCKRIHPERCNKWACASQREPDCPLWHVVARSNRRGGETRQVNTRGSGKGPSAPQNHQNRAQHTRAAPRPTPRHGSQAHHRAQAVPQRSQRWDQQQRHGAGWTAQQQGQQGRRPFPSGASPPPPQLAHPFSLPPSLSAAGWPPLPQPQFGMVTTTEQGPQAAQLEARMNQVEHLLRHLAQSYRY